MTRLGWTLAAVWVLFVAVGVAYVRADLPTRFPNHSREWQELIVEGPAKAHEARNRALFGDWKANPVDEYQFWRAQSPVWVYPLSWTFRAFGVGYLQLRLHSVLMSSIGLVAVMLIAARRYSGWPVVASGLFVAVNFYYIFFSRGGLLEPTLNSMLSLTVLFLLLGLSSPVWLVVAQVAFVAAFLTKQSAAVLAPLMMIGTVWGIVRAKRAPRAKWTWLAPLGSALVLLTAVAFYVRTDDYWRTVVWNFGHVLFNDSRVGKVDISIVPYADIFERLASWKRWRDGVLLLIPVAAPLIVLELGRMSVTALRTRKIEPWDAFIAVWFFSALASLQMTPLRSIRFSLLLIPPGALLAAAGFHTLTQWTGRVRLDSWPARVPKPQSWLPAVLVVALLATHGVWFGRWVAKRTYILVDTNESIEDAVGAQKAVIVGAWAAPLVFETPYHQYYVKARFNASKEALADLGVTHLLVRSRNDFTYSIVKRRFPDLRRRMKKLERYRLWRGMSAELSALDPPLGQ